MIHRALACLLLLLPALAWATPLDLPELNKTPSGGTPMDHFPALVSADATRIAAVQSFINHGCHPDDEYQEGDCDWTVTMAIHRVADGHVEKTVDFILCEIRALAPG